MATILEDDWDNLVRTCSLDNWRQVLAGILSRPSPQASHLAPLSNALATRMENETTLLAYACLVFICAGNRDKVGWLIHLCRYLGQA